MLSLANKVIAIIGGTTGLGRSAARACIAAGAKLVVVGRKEADVLATEAELGSQIVAGVTGDACDSATADRAVARAVARFGRLDGLYHVAGGSGRRAGDGPLHELSDDGWRETLELNLAGVAWSNRAAVRQFLAQGGGGAVLNMASVLAFSPSPQFFATHAYAAAKAGAIGFTLAAAAYYAPHNIRFNVVAPGLVETPMAQRAAHDEEIRRFIQVKQPLDGGRLGQPDDLDAAVVFLLSDAARFITGQTLAIDGGWCIGGG